MCLDPLIFRSLQRGISILSLVNKVYFCSPQIIRSKEFQCCLHFDFAQCDIIPASPEAVSQCYFEALTEES